MICKNCGKEIADNAIACPNCGVAAKVTEDKVNIGLAILECEEAAEEIKANDEVSVDFDTGLITDITTGKTYTAQPFPEFIQNIIKSGGLLNSIKNGGGAND